MLAAVARLNPFTTPEARRLATLFGIVYFSQGMWYLPNQTILIVFKDRGLSAGEVATLMSIVTVPWLLKPVYGLLSDFVPIFGRRRRSYFLLMSGFAAVAGFVLAGRGDFSYGTLVLLFTLMGLGLAFTDVVTDALMVENGRPRGLTGAFQSVQWAAIYGAAIIVGLLGGALAERRALREAFAIAAAFALVSWGMALFFVREPRAPADAGAFRSTLRAIRVAARDYELWAVAGFILCFTFSPSFGPALVYYQTDHLHFSQQFIGVLTALGSASAVAGAMIYAPISRRVPLRRLIVVCVGLAVGGTLAYLFYRSAAAAIAIDTIFGCASMIVQLALLDLAAKACPRRVEGTFFALLMSLYNGGTQGSQVVGGYLYDALGYTPLVLISAATTALVWALVPLVRIERIEARARAEIAASSGPRTEDVGGAGQSVSAR